MPFPHTLSALLFQMQNRLGMYIHPPTLPSLMNFISGYTTATRCHHIDEPDTLCPFHDFVAQQPGYAESTAGLANMILAYVCGFSPADVDCRISYPSRFPHSSMPKQSSCFTGC